jgi:hypothetical protein
VRRFRERNGIKAGTRAGDAAEAPALLANLAPISRDRLKQELQGYNLDDVYNAYACPPPRRLASLLSLVQYMTCRARCCRGEFATFYNIAPKRTLDTSRLSNAGGKKDRQRMSLLLLVRARCILVLAWPTTPGDALPRPVLTDLMRLCPVLC